MSTFRLRNGSTLNVTALDTDGIRELFEAVAAADNDGVLAVIRRMLPDATKADLLCLQAFPEDAVALARLASGASPISPLFPH
jgi:hypothetical protein